MAQTPGQSPAETAGGARPDVQLLVRPLGAVLLHAVRPFGNEYTLPEPLPTALQVFDLATSGEAITEEQILTLFPAAGQQGASRFCRQQVATVLEYYGVDTVAEATCLARERGDIPVRVEHPRWLKMQEHWTEILDLAAQGKSNPEIAELLGLTEGQLVFARGGMQQRFRCPPNLVAMLRRSYELGIRQAHPGGIEFKLNTSKRLYLNETEARLLHDRSMGLDNAASGESRGVTEDTQKTHMRRTLARFNASDASEAIAKAITARLMAAEYRPHTGPWLTPPELQGITLAAQGLSNGKIGEVMWVTEDTVKTHLRRLAIKLGTTGLGREATVRRCFEARIFTIAPDVKAT